MDHMAMDFYARQAELAKAITIIASNIKKGDCTTADELKKSLKSLERLWRICHDLFFKPRECPVYPHVVDETFHKLHGLYKTTKAIIHIQMKNLPLNDVDEDENESEDEHEDKAEDDDEDEDEDADDDNLKDDQ